MAHHETRRHRNLTIRRFPKPAFLLLRYARSDRIWRLAGSGCAGRRSEDPLGEGNDGDRADQRRRLGNLGQITLPARQHRDHAEPHQPASASHGAQRCGCTVTDAVECSFDPAATGEFSAALDNVFGFEVGTGTTQSARTMVCSAQPPTIDRAATRSPIETSETADPTDSTTPTTSQPGTNGGLRRSGCTPCITNRSAKLMPAASTLMRTSSGPGTGIFQG
jgi:hypothetical protein